MSQRVQKGSTVFRPVARPRARPGVESRQSSVLPEPASRPQDASSSSSMPPPTSTTQKPPSDLPAAATTPSTLSQETASPAPPQPSYPQAPVAVREPPSRMPPMIGSAEPISHDPHPSLSEHPPHAVDDLTTSAAAHLAQLLMQHNVVFGGSDHQYSNASHFSHHIPVMNEQFHSIPYPIGHGQIDPQLMGPSNASGIPPYTPSEAHSIYGSSVDNRPFTANDENANEPASKRRRTSGTGRSRTRPPSPPPFDPEADPGEELDPTTVTMATLCDDTGRGRVSTRAAQIVSNHVAWRAANRNKRARIKAIMEAKKYGRNLEEEEETSQTQMAETTTTTSNPEAPVADSASHPEASVAQSASNPEEAPVDSVAANVEEDKSLDKGADGFDYSEDLSVSRYNVQVRIGANGETIIDEDSLLVNRDEEHRTEDYTHVEESDFTKFVNSATYSKKVRGSRWSAEETELFYDALSQFGENYELISYVLPGRDRKACKNKFKTEDKKNPARITHCLENRRPYDIATLSRMTGKDFSGPTPEIRAPTPVSSAQLQDDTQPIAEPPSPKVVRKKSRTPSVRDEGVEILGDIDDIDKDDDP